MAMHPAAAARVCEFVIANCRQLRGVIFIVRFMKKTLRAELTPERANELTRIELGAFILLLLPHDMQFKLRPLVAKPQRILEHLLMNKQAAFVKLALSQLDTDDADALTSEQAFSQQRGAEVPSTPSEDSRTTSSQDGGRRSPRQTPRKNLSPPTPAGVGGGAAPGSPFVVRKGRAVSVSLSGAGAGASAILAQRRLVEKVAEFRHDLISFYADKAVAAKSVYAADDWPTDWVAR
jgi:hypothetical protein